MAFNTNRADYDMYINLYNKYSTTNIIYNAEILFQVLCKIGGFLKVSYEIFYAIYSIFPLFLIAISIKKMSKNISLVAGCFFIFPFALDAVQMRHFMSIALITWGITFIINSNDKKGILKYIIINFIAIGFHYSAFFFLFIPLIKMKKNNLIILVILLILIEIIFINTDLLVDILKIFIVENKVEAYFLRERWKIDFEDAIVVIFFQAVILPISYFVQYVFNLHNQNLEYEDKQKDSDFINLIIKINWVMMILIPLYTYNMELMRIFRGVLLLNYIAISNILINQKLKDNIIVFYVLLFSVILYLWFMIIHVGTFDTTILKLLNFNNFIK